MGVEALRVQLAVAVVALRHRERRLVLRGRRQVDHHAICAHAGELMAIRLGCESAASGRRWRTVGRDDTVLLVGSAEAAHDAGAGSDVPHRVAVRGAGHRAVPVALDPGLRRALLPADGALLPHARAVVALEVVPEHRLRDLELLRRARLLDAGICRHRTIE